MDEIALRALLVDFYGSLLTPKQQIVYDLYYQQDLSLGEIAEQQRVSRQAVYDLLKRTDAALHDYEKKLNLIEKQQKNRELITLLRAQIKAGAQDITKPDSSRLDELLDKLENNW